MASVGYRLHQNLVSEGDRFQVRSYGAKLRRYKSTAGNRFSHVLHINAIVAKCTALPLEGNSKYFS